MLQAMQARTDSSSAEEQMARQWAQVRQTEQGCTAPLPERCTTPMLSAQTLEQDLNKHGCEK